MIIYTNQSSRKTKKSKRAKERAQKMLAEQNAWFDKKYGKTLSTAKVPTSTSKSVLRTDYAWEENARRAAEHRAKYPSLITTFTATTPVQKVKYDDPEMVRREQLAQEEVERKKKRTAPLWNKGGYQYIPDDMDLSTLGRKV